MIIKGLLISYFTWNNLLSEHFFNKANEGTWVLLSLDEDLINNLGKRINQNYSNFVESMKADITEKKCPYHKLCNINLDQYLNEKQNPIKNIIALEQYYNYHKKKGISFVTPPFVAYLCFFIIPTLNRSRSYYRPLNHLLFEEISDKIPSGFENIQDIFYLLETWTFEQNGKYGLFIAKSNVVHDKYVNVGCIWTQGLLNPSDKNILYLIFSTYKGLKEITPSKLELIYIIRNSKYKKHLRNKILDIINKPNRADKTQQALLQLIQQEFQNWNGTVNTKLQSLLEEEDKNIDGFGHLSLNFNDKNTLEHIQLKFHLVNDKIKGKIRIRTNDNQYLIKLKHTDWSSPIYNITENNIEGNILEPIDFIFDKKMFNSENWKGKYTGENIMYFRKEGFYPGLSRNEFIQKSNLIANETHIIITSKNNRLFENWISNKNNYQQGRLIHHKYGNYFDLYAIKNPLNDIINSQSIIDDEDIVINFIGGIKGPMIKKHEYLLDFPPIVNIKPFNYNFSIYLTNINCIIHKKELCNHKLLKKLTGVTDNLSTINLFNEESNPIEDVNGYYMIKLNDKLDQYYNVQLEIIVVRSNSILAKKQLKFVSTFKQFSPVTFVRDEYFKIIDNYEKYIDFYIFDISRKFALEYGCDLTFIGLKPGEIINFNLKTKKNIYSHYNKKYKKKYGIDFNNDQTKSISPESLYLKRKSKLNKVHWKPIWVIIHQKNIAKLELVVPNTKINRDLIKIDINSNLDKLRLKSNSKSWFETIVGFNGRLPKSMYTKDVWYYFVQKVKLRKKVIL